LRLHLLRLLRNRPAHLAADFAASAVVSTARCAPSAILSVVLCAARAALSTFTLTTSAVLPPAARLSPIVVARSMVDPFMEITSVRRGEDAVASCRPRSQLHDQSDLIPA
jgi:hypothetical protein